MHLHFNNVYPYRSTPERSIADTPKDSFSVNEAKTKLASSWNRERFMNICEVFLVVCAIAIIIGLFAIPTVFYALSSKQAEVSSEAWSHS